MKHFCMNLPFRYCAPEPSPQKLREGSYMQKEHAMLGDSSQTNQHIPGSPGIVLCSHCPEVRQFMSTC